MAVPVSELQKVAPSAIIELFELQLNAAQHGINDTYRFHAGTSLNANGNIVWAGNSYTRFPVEVEGFEYNGKGTLPRPKLRASNVLSNITALILSTPSGLEGAKLTRIRTLARYLDAVNFPGGVNTLGTPDPTAEFPREIFYLDRKTAETREVVEFECAAAFDLAGVRAPKRQCVANICQWVYKSTECGYSRYANPALANHYTIAGYYEGRNLNAGGTFNPAYYIGTYPDLSAAGYTTANAHVHYLATGIYEGRSANAAGPFNANYYLDTYVDLNVLVSFNENDQPQASLASDICGKRLTSCRLRFGTYSPLPYGSFPGIGTYLT